MRRNTRCAVALASALTLLGGCRPTADDAGVGTMSAADTVLRPVPGAVARGLAQYTTVTLATDTAALSPKERQMIPLLVEAAKLMDEVYWREVYGDEQRLLAALPDDSSRRYAEINYGPWDRLANDSAWVQGVGPRPPGARFYPADITKEEFDAAVAAGPAARADSLKSLYTVVRRDSARGLVAVPYSREFATQHQRAAELLRQAAALAEDAGLQRYLTLRADALLSDDYRASDLAWMDMKDNVLDVVIGPIEVYDDQLYGYKAAHEAFVLVKDTAWSQRLARYSALLPALQRGLPVDERFRRETPGTDSDLNAYDAVYYAGQANSGSKTIAINLPNDEQVQLQKGTRRLQLKNAIRAKFDAILMPIARELIGPDQLPQVTFDAFFENVMFHEVAHGLGIKNTVTGKGTVRDALKERYSALEEGKADILGLYMVQALDRQGELGQHELRDNYVSFLASLFRSVRFGASNAHGRANLAAFNFLAEQGAFARDASGHWRVDVPKFEAAMTALTRTIITLQGTGDYAGVGAFEAKYGVVGPELRADLDRLDAKGIPVDIVFEQ
jgi:hypothetical protein